MKTIIHPNIYLLKDFGRFVPHFGVGDKRKDKRVPKVYAALERVEGNVFAVYTHFSAN